ncbi:MAG: peptidoglycan DD-metalloendopeptidase family protein [Granulosicoccus sp.]|nr:peptidoglycan DD-metalloendopeptidase family protein [Granulosicoccus sp.]
MTGSTQSRIITRLASLLVLLVFVVGCVSTAPAPVINKSPNRQIPPQRVVKPGESIYAISWQYGLDFLDVAQWNGLKPPYRLKQGQRLSLRPGARPTGFGESAVVVKPLEPAPQTTTTPLPSTPPKTTGTAGAASKPLADSTSNAALTANKPALSAPKKWQWPATGKVIEKFSRKGGVNGIRIAAADGAAVRASAKGDVVYVGEGLRGYGKLIIVKHSTKFLSAYAHNRKVLVAEGQRVDANEQIAEMGSTGADRTMLHFEIRVNGKPEDPLKYLR